jgi:hypothetical protein
VAPPPAVPQSNGLALGSKITGIIALVLTVACGLFGGALVGGPAGIVAAVLGFLGMRKASESPAGVGKGQAIAGLVTGALSVVLLVLFIALFGLAILAGDSSSDY